MRSWNCWWPARAAILAAAAGEKYTPGRGRRACSSTPACCTPTGRWPLGPCRLHSVVFHPAAGGRQPGQRVLAEISAAAADRPQPPLRRAASAAWNGSGRPWASMERAFRAVVNEQPGVRVQGPRGAVRDAVPAGGPRPRHAQPLPKKALRSADRIKTMLQFVQDPLRRGPDRGADRGQRGHQPQRVPAVLP